MTQEEFFVREVVLHIHRKGLASDLEVIRYLEAADLPSYAKCLIAGNLLSKLGKALMSLRNLMLVAEDESQKEWGKAFNTTVSESLELPEDKLEDRPSRMFALTAPTDHMKSLAVYIDSVLFVNPNQTPHMALDQTNLEEFCADIFSPLSHYANSWEKNSAPNPASL